MKSGLADVTVCAVDCATTSLAARALGACVEACSFGDAILFCDIPTASVAFRTVQISRLASRADYSRFVIKDLARYITTPFVLIVQWDGYVVEPRAWTPDFLRYDMIGARWPWHKDGMTVGNGGFSLRSRRLLEITSSARFSLDPDENEDSQICRAQRAALEREFDVRFAPESAADRFSYERSIPDGPTFGFHGLFNMWRHVEDDEMIEMAREFAPHVLRSREFLELLAQYVHMRKFGPVRALYAQWKKLCGDAQMRAQLLSASGSIEFTESVLRICAATAAFS